MTDGAAGGTTTTATTQAAAATGATAAATSQTTPGSAPASTDWTSGLSDELRGYVQTKGFKDPSAVVDSYRNFEKLHGVPHDKIIKLPENMDSPEGKAIWEKLGAPKDAKEYKIEIPPEYGGEEFGGFIRDVASKTGMTHKQVETLVQGLNEQAGKSIKAEQEATSTQVKAAQSNLEKEWGAALEQNTNIADSAALKLGMDEKEIVALGSALGRDKAMFLLHKLGKATGEAGFITGQKLGAGEILPPAYARQQIGELMKDASFSKRFKSGEADAVARWNKLHEQAYGVGARA